MKDKHYFLLFVILIVIQMFLDSFLNLSHYLSISLLPAMIMCIPLRSGTSFTLLVAFVCGFAVDFFEGGVLGLTSVALLPVALLRGYIFRLCFDFETISRTEEISVRKMGLPRLLVSISMGLAIFLLIYIWIDGAGTRTFGFNLSRFFLSYVADILLATVTLYLFSAQADR